MVRRLAATNDVAFAEYLADLVYPAHGSADHLVAAAGQVGQDRHHMVVVAAPNLPRDPDGLVGHGSAIFGVLP